ncbi:MAG: hypothetical protein FJ184_16180 [Gammaproteobacteria bacterium]|nr:hypothetical protein [Gammaproteobacteria bacterium]
MILKIGDHFFSSRPIPGVSEYSRLSMQVARDLSGALTLVPLLPLAGTSVARVGGAPSPAALVMTGKVAPSEETSNVFETTALPVAGLMSPRVGMNPVRALSGRLHLPSSLAAWLLSPDGVGASSGSISAAKGLPSSASSVGLAAWMQSLAASLSQSGLFFESQLRERRPVPIADLKRRLLEIIETRREGPAAAKAWSALDDLVGLQSAATTANRSGGAVFSFVFPSPDGLGGWWITLDHSSPQKPLDYSGGDGRGDDTHQPWRMRLVGISLPFGDIDVRIEQVGRSGVGITVLTDTANQQMHWDESKTELSRRLRDAGLNLSRWSVIEPQQDTAPPMDPGQLHSIRV